MSLVVVSGLSIAYGATVVLRDVDLRIEAGDRIGLVGPNGAGKTSLLAALMGESPPAAGSVETQRGLRIAYLPQDAPLATADTVLGEVMDGRRDLLDLQRDIADLERRMAADDHAAAVLERYGDAQHRYESGGGYELEASARAALGGLGLGADDIGRSPTQLSGGQQRRVELAKLLVQNADLLLIDEPTNHLDLAAIEWLEEFMSGVRTAFVIVSHDRRFLDRVCTAVIEVAHGVTEHYPGNYSQYVRLRGERRARRHKEFESQQAQINHQEDFIRRYKAGQRAREARGRQKQLDRLERVDAPRPDRKPRLRFRHSPGPNILLRTGDLGIGRETELLTHKAITIEPGERIAIVGPNGCGKSTLLMTLAGELTPRSGKVTLGSRGERRLYRQDLSSGDTAAAERSVLEELLIDHPIGDERGRTLLASLLFSGDDVHKQVGDLSGGERARLLMGKLALEPSNLLLLDEPTNHLDIPAQEVLEEALLGFPGGVVLVTHDRALIDAVATRTWSVESGGIREVLGGYSDLLRARQREAQAAALAASGTASRRLPGKPRTDHTSDATPDQPTMLNANQVRRLEAEIADLEAQLATVTATLLDPATFATADLGASVGKEHDRLKAELGALYERWSSAG